MLLIGLSIAAIVLLPIVWIKYRTTIKEFNTSQIIYLLLSGLFLAVHFATWISSLEYTSIASSVVLVTTTPIWVAIFSPIVLKEKNSLGIWIGIIITIIGSIFVSLQQVCGFRDFQLMCVMMDGYQDTTTMLGNFLAVCGAWAAAAYLMIGRKVRKDIPITAYIFCVYSTGAILLVINEYRFWSSIGGFSTKKLFVAFVVRSSASINRPLLV